MKWSGISKKKKAYLMAFAGLASVLVWAFISAGVITHDFNRNQLSTDGNRQEADISGIILTETKDKQKYWELYGEKGTYDSSSQISIMDNVVGNFYKNNEVSMSFQSSKGTYNAETNVIILYENTYVVLKDGITLKADRLKYSGSNAPIIAKNNVIITKDRDFMAKADEVEINPNFESFKIKGKTTTNIYEDKR